MAKTDIWMPLYISDYLGDTSRLTTLGHGAYLLLIMDYWMSGSPADDDEELAAITRMNIDEWKILRPKIAKFFKQIDGKWYHKRIEDEKENARNISEKRSKSGLDGAAKRWQGHSKRNSKSNDKDDGNSNANVVAIGLTKA